VGSASAESPIKHISGYPAASLDEWRAECVACGLIDPELKRDSARTLFSKNKLQLITANWIAAGIPLHRALRRAAQAAYLA
jgi:hypothetical protein